MRQEARSGTIEEILLGLQCQRNDRIQSKAGRLTDALQAGAVFDTCKIATELTKYLALSATSETGSTLSEVSDSLHCDAVFSNCDRVSYLLLDLERKLYDLRSRASTLCIQSTPNRHKMHVPADANYECKVEGVECAPW